MKFPASQPVIAALCLLLFAAVWLWQSPSLLGGKIGSQELDAYLAVIEQLAMPPQEKAEALQRLRRWGETDDGRPFYMVNMMRYREALLRYPGAPDNNMTPEASNRHYEQSVMALVFKVGAYPLAAGNVQSESVLPTAAGHDNWGRMIVVRYPSRRAFFELLTDPAYRPYAPYKFMSMDTALVPAEVEFLWPEPRWLAGGILLILFLGIGWLRAARAGS